MLCACSFKNKYIYDTKEYGVCVVHIIIWCSGKNVVKKLASYKWNINTSRKRKDNKKGGLSCDYEDAYAHAHDMFVSIEKKKKQQKKKNKKQKNP